LTWTIFPILSKWPIFPNGRFFLVDHYTVDLFSISGPFFRGRFFRGPYFLNSGTIYRSTEVSLLKLYFFSPAISRPAVIFGPSCSCPAFSVNPLLHTNSQRIVLKLISITAARCVA